MGVLHVHDNYAIHMVKQDKTVGHIPRDISKALYYCQVVQLNPG